MDNQLTDIKQQLNALDTKDCPQNLSLRSIEIVANCHYAAKRLTKSTPLRRAFGSAERFLRTATPALSTSLAIAFLGAGLGYTAFKGVATVSGFVEDVEEVKEEVSDWGFNRDRAFDSRGYEMNDYTRGYHFLTHLFVLLCKTPFNLPLLSGVGVWYLSRYIQTLEISEKSSSTSQRELMNDMVSQTQKVVNSLQRLHSLEAQKLKEAAYWVDNISVNQRDPHAAEIDLKKQYVHDTLLQCISDKQA